MTPELQKYYETYFDLFTTDGWKQFIEDVTESAESFNVRNVPDESALKFVQGQLLILDQMMNWEISIRNAFDSIEEEEKEEE
jgi:hypothetical protein